MYRLEDSRSTWSTSTCHVHLTFPLSFVLPTANADAIVHAQQTSNMTASMKSTAQMLQEIQCGTAAEVSDASN